MALRAFCEVPVNQEKQTGECGVRDFDAPAEPRSLGDILCYGVAAPK